MNLGDNPTLKNKIEDATDGLKGLLVDYVGDKQEPENDEVTVEMIINTLADEFPEFLMVVAEENWIRGYHQALTDVEAGQKIYEEEKQKAPDDLNEE
tara:strand:+ start:184 stop:474 length:291 start_codon:yes stop_codon:yes gene_type:complete